MCQGFNQDSRFCIILYWPLAASGLRKVMNWFINQNLFSIKWSDQKVKDIARIVGIFLDIASIEGLNILLLLFVCCLPLFSTIVYCLLLLFPGTGYNSHQSSHNTGSLLDSHHMNHMNASNSSLASQISPRQVRYPPPPLSHPLPSPFTTWMPVTLPWLHR